MPLQLQNLPREIILNVLDILPTHSIEKLALTFNQPITGICLPLLQPLFKYRRDRERFINRFGPLKHRVFSFEGYDEDQLSYFQEKLGISPDAVINGQPWESHENFETVSNLNLCSNFKLFQPLPDSMTSDYNINSLKGGQALVEPEDYGMVASAAERAGVNLPSALIKFLRDGDQQTNFYTVEGDRYMICPDRLSKVPQAWDGIGGYWLPLMYNWGYQGWIGLYIEPGDEGSSCILMSFSGGKGQSPNGQIIRASSLVTPEERQEAIDLDLDVLAPDPDDEFLLVGIDFETFLLDVFYQAKLGWLCCDKEGIQPTETVEYI